MDVSVAFTDKQMLMATHHSFAFLSDNKNGNGKESKKVRIILCLVPPLSFSRRLLLQVKELLSVSISLFDHSGKAIASRNLGGISLNSFVCDLMLEVMLFR